MPKLLVTRPQYDLTTRYLFYWSTLYMQFAKQKGFQVLDLDGKRANRKELTSIIKKIKPQLICFNGHGNYDLITGQDGEILVKTKDNESLLVGAIINMLSCGSGKLLGPACLQKGALVFIGYQESFIFYYNNEETSNPLNDNRAKLFLEPANVTIRSLLKGHTAKEAYEKSQNLYSQNIQKLLASNSPEAYLARYLIWDMRHQVCLGNQNVSL